MSVKERIIKFIKYKNIGQAAFEKNVGLSNGYINNIRQSIQPDKVQKIALKYPELNTGWLMTGNGEMLNLESTLKEPVLYYGGEKSILLPLIPVEAVAGFPQQDNDGITLAECEQYAVPEFSNKGVEFLIRVSGSSMYPKYSNGDLLACKKVPAITFFQWGKVYVLDTIQGALVKRLFEDKNSPENVLCFSDNKENYPEFTLPKSEIRSLSIVLGVIRME